MQSKSLPLRMLIAGGGTGGHISPAIAVIEEIRDRHVELDPLWIGSHTGFESEAAANIGVPFRVVQTGKLRRYLSIHTLFDAVRIPIGIAQSIALVHSYSPHVIFSTGGFVSVPSVVAGKIWKVPSITHEQTASLGLATKINARICDRIALSYAYTPIPVTGKHGVVIVTGNPVRSALINNESPVVSSQFDLAGDRPLVYITGGAQGASAINRVVAKSLPTLLKNVEIVHQCGPDTINHDFNKLVHLRSNLPGELAHRYHPVERVGEELRSVYAEAELVVSRSGAGTVAELAALGLPSILIPLPGTTEQRRNAQVLVGVGAALLIPEEELTPQRLSTQISALLADPERLAVMRSEALKVAPNEKPSARLTDEIFELAERTGWIHPDVTETVDPL